MRWPHFLAAPGRRQGVQSALLALFVAGVTSSAVHVFGWKWQRALPRAKAIAAARRAHFDLSRDQVLVPVAPELEANQALPEATLRRNRSASEMFELARQARTRGDVPEAIRLSQQIEQFFPNSEQGILSHLSLGVLYLQQGQPNLALQEFATFRRVGSPEMKAEAYFGQAQALRLLGRAEDERTVLEEMLQAYPRSAYVAAARTRLGELVPDRAGH